MNIKIISFDKGKDRALKKVEATFIERLSKFCKVEFIDLRRSAHYDSADPNTIRREEAETVVKKIKDTDFLVLLDASGEQMDSICFAQALKAWQQKGTNSVVFIIGGPLGLSDDLKKKADRVLSLSRLTFTHEMARMLLCEVLYRSFDILHGGNYHK